MPDRTRPPAAQTFLEHRRRQESIHEGKSKWSDDPMASLISIEVNLIDACNRKCHFCPHAMPVKYPNRYDQKMSGQLVRILALQLEDMKYEGRISLSGYGEPMLNKEIAGHINIFRQHLPNNAIEMNTNGDPLTVANIQRVFGAGLTQMYVNLYDHKDQASKFIKMFRDAGEHNFVLRPHFDRDDKYGLIINNRSGAMKPLAKALEKSCGYTAYKAFVDWEGSVNFCANSWGREIIIGNIQTSHIRDIWLSEQMKEIRKKLFYGDRSMAPCNTCNVHGTLHGKTSMEVLRKHYGWDALPDD